MNENFFKLNLKYKEAADFNHDLIRSQNLYKASYNFLLEADKLFTVENEKQADHGKLIDYYRRAVKMQTNFNDAYYNLLISYYAFRKAAETNEEINKEFRKMPDSFDSIKRTLSDINEGYEKYVKVIQQLI